MLAILYLLLSAIFGICFVGLCVPDVRRLYIACSPTAKAIAHIPNTLFTVPAGIVTGMMCVPFFNYYVTLGLTYVFNDGSLCMKLGVLITFAFFIWMILTCLILINRKRVKREELGSTKIEDYRSNILDALYYGLITVALTATATFLMFYTYRISNGQLLSGFSTFSDLSPHTAMVSSFGKGFNFPTQYMHFSGDGIKYHFFFYFLAGMLEYLGLPIDYAINLPSVIAMVCALVLLGLLAVLISSRRAAFAVAPVLVLFRSSLNAFVHLKELMAQGNSLQQAVKAILEYNLWYKVTDYDDWGIWAINVYPNQRHLMLGVAVIVMMVILFLPFVRRLGISISRSESFGDGVKAFAFSKNAWLTRTGDPLYPVSIAFLACVIVCIMPYFHGSCLIALLLVLFGMAIFSESRLIYLVVAVFAVGSSYAQTLAFSGGYNNVVSFTFAPGFILDKPSFAVLARYLFIVTGLTLILAFIYAVTVLIIDIVRKKPIHRLLLFICALNPMIFAFLFQVTLEKLANHKFIQVSLILVDVFVAALIANLLYIPFKIRKASEAADESASAFEDNDTVDASSDDGDLAINTISDTPGVRTPVLSAGSAFGDIIEDEKEEDSIDIEAMDSHTGIDADVTSLNGDSSETKEEVKEEKAPELLFGDEDKKNETESDAEAEEKAEDNSEEKSEESTDEKVEGADEAASDDKSEEKTEEEIASEKEEAEAKEAKAGVETLAALFGEEVKPSAEEDKKEETAEDKSEEKKSDEAEDVSDADDSDEALHESTKEPAHASMRPGSEVLFGEEEPDDSDDGNVMIQSSDEVINVVEADAVISREDLDPSSLKHEPVKSKKEKGLPLSAWIALEIAGCILAIALMLPLTATGISEWATYINLNKSTVSANVNSPLTKWVMENTEPDDVFLTSRWSMNRFILAGRPMYYGWPYYAWSAGHDTYTRETIYLWLISGCGDDIEEFTRYCKERRIKYLIVDQELIDAEFDNGVKFNKEFVDKNLTQVAYFAEEDTRIYKIY